jgi:L-ascorbate metabolism protein UlaG (beta-lactamase superfamily)
MFEGVAITWLGHAAVRIELPDGAVLLIDPWLTGNPSCPAEFHAPERVDGILITHGHYDHFGDTLSIASAHGPNIYAIHEICVFLEAQGIDSVVGMNKGGTVTVPGGVEATMVDAVHSSGLSADGGIVDGGSPAGWVLRLPSGGVIYHAGDTALFGDMSLIGERSRPDLAILPIGGHYTMGPEDAAQAAILLRARAVLPVHWGTYPILSGRPADLKEALNGSGIAVVSPAIGAALAFGGKRGDGLFAQ